MKCQLTITAVVCLAAGLTQPLQAQNPKRISRTSGPAGGAAGLVPTQAETNPSGQYSAQDLEDLRALLLKLGDTVEQFAILAPPDSVDLDSLHQAESQIRQMPYQQLNALRKGLSPSKINSRLQRARDQIKGYADQRVQAKAASARKISPMLADPNPFPVVSGLCDPIGNAVASAIGGTAPGGSTAGPARIPVGVILAADIVLFVADSVRELAQDACKQDVLGENTSLACTVVDIVWIVAEAVDEGIHFCDDDLTGNVIDTNYARLDDVHSDLYAIGTAVDTHLTNANTDIDTKIAALDTHVTNVDNHIQTEFATLTTVVTTAIANLSAQLGAATNLTVADLQQIMKLDMTPEGQRVLIPSILTCDGTAAHPCPKPLAACQGTGCSWNNVGPLP